MFISDLAARGPTSHEGLMHTTDNNLVDLVLSLLYVSKVVFHLMLDCNVFSLVTVIQRCIG